MKINRVLVLSFGILAASYTQVHAEDCVWGSHAWSGPNMNGGLLVKYDCYTDSSHNTKVSSGETQLNLPIKYSWQVNGEGWQYNSETGIIYHTSSSTTYTLDSAPKSRESTSTYEGGKKTESSSTSYYSDGTKKSEYTYTYDENGYTTGYSGTSYRGDGTKDYDTSGTYGEKSITSYYLPDGITKTMEEYNTYSEYGQTSSQRTYFDKKGRKIREAISSYCDDYGYCEYTDTKSYTYHDDGSYSVYDSDGNLLETHAAEITKTPKRIYTIEEAVEATKNSNGKNTFKIRYR